MTEQDPPATNNSSGDRSRQLRIPLDPPMLVVLALAFVGLALMCVFGIMLLAPEGGFFGRGGDEDPSAEETPFAGATPSGENVLVISDGVNTLSIDLDPPTMLGFSSQTYPIRTQFVSQTGTWTPSGEAGAAEWVYGTIVNYVFGLEGSAANRALLEGLVPGDTVAVTTLAGVEREFVITGRELSSATNAELFAQTRPRLTLVWLGDLAEEQRLVVFGDFVLPETEGAAGQPEALVEIGQMAQLADLRLLVNNTTQIVDSPATPPGFSLFLVDFELENIGQAPLDTGLLRLVLVDELGNQYSLNAAASQEGRFPILSGFVESGTVRPSTAGYQVPTNLNSTSLRLVVSRVDSPGQIEVLLPFASPDQAVVSVSLEQADFSTDGTSLILTGQVTNLGTQPLIIGEANVRLESSGTLYLVLSTSPGFPWTVNGGQSLPFAVTFQRPATPTAIFSLMGQSFELNGLR